MSDEIKSPFVDPEVPQQYDYEQHQDNTTMVAVRKIWQMFGENADLLTQLHDTKKEEIQDRLGQISQKIIEIIAECNVPDQDLKFLVENFQVAIYSAFDNVQKLKHKLEEELRARTLNARDPGHHHFSPEYSTLGDLFKALEAKRIEQQDDPYGFFFVDKK